MPDHPSIKHLLKRGIQYAAANLGRHTRKSQKAQLLILMYHRILPIDEPCARLEEPGMMVTPTSFASHISYLSDYFEFITLSDWLDRRNKDKPLPSHACAITFDDGWADNYEYAFPILKQYQIPASIFLVAEMMGTNEQFWPEKLARLVEFVAKEVPDYWTSPVFDWLTSAKTDYPFGDSQPNNEHMSQIIAYAKQYSDAENFQHLQEMESTLSIKLPQPPPELLDWEQINNMAHSGLIEFGSHTCRHTRLEDGLATSTLEHEIIRSKNIIQEKTGQNVKTFCFPNGDYSQQALGLVKQHYLGAVTTTNGWNTKTTDNFLLQRIGIHEDIAADRIGFLSRVSGWI